AHLRGVVHRDLKPGNVLLVSGVSCLVFGSESAAPTPNTKHQTPNSLVPKITDFGLAKHLDENRRDVSDTGAVLGTPQYMAPEQAEGKVRDIGPAADVYALGALLYRCLTGRPPFDADSPLRRRHKVWHAGPVPRSRLVPKLPRDLETICLTCLHKKPERRYADAGTLADELRRYAAGEPIRARRVSRTERFVKWARRH